MCYWRIEQITNVLNVHKCYFFSCQPKYWIRFEFSYLFWGGCVRFLSFGHDTILFTLNIMLIHLNIAYFTQYYTHNIFWMILRITVNVTVIIWWCISLFVYLPHLFWAGTEILYILFSTNPMIIKHEFKMCNTSEWLSYK